MNHQKTALLFGTLFLLGVFFLLLPPVALAGHPPTPGGPCTNCDPPPPPPPCPTCCPAGGGGGGGPLGGGGGKPINFWSGQEFFTHTDLVLPGLMDIRIQRLYDSQIRYDSALGYGWSLNYFIRLYEYTDGSVVLRQYCGDRKVFELAGGAYQTPVGETGTLVKNGDGTWTYIEKTGEKKEFDTQGVLTAIVSRQGPRLVFTYDTRGKLPLIGVSPFAVDPNTPLEVAKEYRLLKIEEQDASGTATGRYVSFTYDETSGRLTGLIDSAGRSVNYTHDTQGNLTQVDLPEGATLIYAYDDPNDPHNATTLTNSACPACGGGTFINTYDSQDRVIQQTHGNHTLDITYDEDLVKTTVIETTKDDAGNVLNTATTQWEFNTTGNPTKITGPLGNQRVYVVDARMYVARYELWENTGTPQSPVLELRYAVDRTFDAQGNVLTKTEAQGTSEERVTTYTYNADNQVTSITVKSVVDSGQNKVMSFAYDANGNLTIRTEQGLLGDATPYTYATTYTYTTNGQLASIDGPRTNFTDVTTFAYDTQGNLTSVTQPGGLTTSLSNYTATGKPQDVTDSNGVSTTYTYDSLGRVKTVSIAGDMTIYTHTSTGMVASVTRPLGNSITYTYNSLNGHRQIKDALGNSIIYTYDSAGNRLKEETKDPLGAIQKVLSFQYDVLNRLTQVINPDSTYNEYSYDAQGNRISLQTPNSQLTTYQYDSLNRLAAVIQPGSITTSYAYNSQDGLTSVTDGNGNTTTYKYDDMGRVYQVVSPDTGTTTYGYDPAGNLISKTDAKGITATYQYDALNRLTLIDFTSDTDVIYTYDTCAYGKGRLCVVQDQAGTTSYEYSAKGEVVRETKVINGVTYVASYSYDSNGNLATMTYPSVRTATYSYDSTDRATSVSTTPPGGTAQTVASAIGYKPFGGLSGLTYGNGLARSVSYDQQYRITSIQTGAVQNLAYSHDSNGNITGITNNLDPTKNKSFTYDTLDRLAGGTGSWGTLSWTYDAVGNRQTQVENAATSTYSYQAGSNRLTGVSGTSPITFTFDANGNTITENTRSYTYNQNNRLIQAAESGTTLGDYTYNANGQRATKTVEGVTTVFHYDLSGQPIAETLSDGSVVAEYIHLNNQPLAKADGTDVFYYANDHLGTPQLLTDATGTVAWEAELKPFGEVVSQTGTVTQPFRFPGQYYDLETGLHQNWMRDYSPKVGRYTSADLLGLLGDERRPTPNHLYAYVENNPVNYADPEGLLKRYRCEILKTICMEECTTGCKTNSEEYMLCLSWCEGLGKMKCCLSSGRGKYPKNPYCGKK